MLSQRITSQKDHFQIWETTDDALNEFIIQYRIGWRNVARQKRSLRLEQLRIVVQVDVRSATELPHPFQKTNVACVPGGGVDRREFSPADRSNAVPLQAASKNQDGRRAGHKATRFRLSEIQHIRNRAAHRL